MCDLVLFRSAVLTLDAATRRPEPEEQYAGIEQGRKSVSSCVIWRKRQADVYRHHA